ncbi:MAG: glycerophosphodiester phosphodiesterase [Myxococcaceae bacterium]
MKFLEGLSPTLHISHRGGAKLSPENTLHAFRRAVSEFRTDMLELDVHASSDGELVVAHDPTVDRCTNGTGAIASLSLRQLEELDAGYRFSPDGRSFPFRGKGVRIPRFVDVLREFPTLRMNVELKPTAAGMEQRLAKLLRDEGAVDRVCIGSESDDVAAKLFEALPEACHFFPREALTAFVMSAKMGQELVDDERYTVLDMPAYLDDVPLIDRAFVELVRSRSKWVNVWTIDDEAQMRALIADGVGGIMTDRPDLLRAALG